MRIIGTTFDVLRTPVRMQQITFVLSRYAVTQGLRSIGIEVSKRGLKIAPKKKGKKSSFDAHFGKRLAEAFIQLGPTFIKVGQMLATRPDIVGEPVSNQLRILFDQVPSMPFRQVKKLLARELGRDVVRSRFKDIESKPLGSASIAQVHRGTLDDGTPVVIKLQKKGVAKLIRSDLIIFELWIRTISPLFPRLDLKRMFDDFKQATLREINFYEEAKNLEQFRKNYRSFFSSSDVVFPCYYPELTTEKVLVLEPMRGKKVSTLRKGSTVARKAAVKGMTAVLQQVFEHGFFHADPHAGNLFFMEDTGQLGFIDLGLVGQFQPEDRKRFLELLLAVLKRDRNHLASALFNLGIPGKRTNYKKFDRSVNQFLDEIKKKGVKNYKIHTLINKLLAIARKHRIYIPNRYVLMLRSFLIIEGVAKSLDPNISLIDIAPPIVAKSLMKNYSPLRFLKRFF